MATTYTTNYNLGKQENHADKFDMDVITDNADKIDAALTGLQSGIDGKQAALTPEQLAAVNSGVTSTDVAQIGINENNISSFYPTSYQTLTPAVNDVTVLSGGYIQIGNVIIISARISITSDQTGNIFHDLPNAITSATLGQAISPINAAAVSASTNDTNLIFFNSDYHKGVIGVASNHTKISTGTYVISGLYLVAANQ